MVLVYVTPAIAEVWLLRNVKNRPEGKAKVAEIKRELELGVFKLNGETIKFCVLGFLRDGQTRLQAIVETGTSAWSWVCYNLPQDVFPSIDQIRPRNLGHMLATEERPNYNSLARAVKVVYQLSEDYQAEPGRFVPRVGLGILADCPAIEDSLRFVMKHRVRDVYPEGTAAGLHFLMRKSDRDKADSFWEAMGTGVITNRRSPIKSVRDQLLTNKLAVGELHRSARYLMAIVLKAWRYYKEGRTCRHIRWIKTEPFPTVA